MAAEGEFPLDPSFHELYTSMKMKGALGWIHLRISTSPSSRVAVVGTGPKGSTIADVQAALSDRECSFMVLDHRFDSDDGIITGSKIFLVCFVPMMAPLSDKSLYEMQKGKALARAATGAIEVTVSTKDDLKRKIYSISTPRRKTKYTDEDFEDADWMDE